ncbi:hypothetical protein [Hymenobacter swuensis]|uniref:Uncharacterized protein n=1 Tax=Hymenobacter swuensis DY53 TaxID=1227739 RepID=W8F285_9BACT|nr:hypothetical protein [Hymenobacter swuensis]AHJ98137.1 hypothetical protein Hsw_2542 [Hymenobacter swuensis DY53]
MRYSTQQILILLAILPTIGTALLAGRNWRRLPAAMRPLAMLSFFALLTEVVSRILWFLKLSNLFIWPIYICVEFALLLELYNRAGYPAFLQKKRWYLIIGLVGLASLEAGLRSTQPLLIDNAVRLVESLLLIGLVLLYYHHSLQAITEQHIWQQPLFWVSTGLLFFFVGNFLIYTFINFALFYSQQFNYQLWLVHAGLNSVLYCLYAYAIWISLRK